jgi:hypothetical protein
MLAAFLIVILGAVFPAHDEVQAAPGDFTTINWSSVASQQYPNSEGQSAVVNGKLYSFGGFDSQITGFVPTRRAYVYDPATNVWTRLADMPKGVTHGGFTTDGTDIYYAGGYIENASQTGQVFGSNEVRRYNVASNTYTSLPNLPYAASTGQLAYLNGVLHYIGGTTSGNRTADLPDHYTFDLASYKAGNTVAWQNITATAGLPNPRQHAGIAVFNGRIYYIGGQTGHDGGLTPQDDVHEYNPATNTWRQMVDMPAPRNHIGNSTVVFDNRILVLGGQSTNGTATNTVFAFDPAQGANGTWTTLNSLPANRHSAVAGVINNTVYLSTGTGSGQGASTLKGVTNAPYIVNTVPTNGATGVLRDTSITATQISFVGSGNGIDENTVFGNMRLVKDSNGSPVPGNIAVSGGNDAVTFQPTVLLEANTTYRFETTSGVKDKLGNSFLPYSMTFTTGTQPTGPTGLVDFNRQKLNVPSLPYTSLMVDNASNRLYATTGVGTIYYWNILADGNLENVGAPGQIALFGQRLIIGIDLDPNSTANNPILWVTHNRGFAEGSGTHFTGALSKLTVTGYGTASEAWTRTDYIVGLPRSYKDHVSNSIDFGPDGALYFVQGSISAMGDRDSAWDYQPEVLLSAAMLRVSPSFLNAPRATPLDVTTGEPVADSPSYPNGNNTGQYLAADKNYGLGSAMLGYTSGSVPAGKFYDPTAPDAPLTIYASGIRNAYDLIWHTNGELYTSTNGSAAGGKVPATPDYANTTACKNRLDDGVYGDYIGPTIANPGSPITQFDFLYRIQQGRYYGHPNPTRCEYVLNGGNPTSGKDPGESIINGQLNTHYSVGTMPDRNWGGYAHDFLNNKSPNGMIEYKSSVFGDALKGKLIVARYTSSDLTVLTLSPSSKNVINENNNVDDAFEGLQKPLDLTEHVATGNLYVAEYHEGNYTDPGSIYLLRPAGVDTTPNILVEQSRLIFSDHSNDTNASAAQLVTIRNTGNGTLNLSSAVLGGAESDQFQISAQPASLTVQPGAAVTIGVRFSANSTGIKSALLNIPSSDPDTPTVSVNLRGLGFSSGGGTNEPSLQRILNTFDIPVNVGDDAEATSFIHGTTPFASLLGEEVAVQSFRKAGSGNVTVEALAAFGPSGANPVVEFGYYPTNQSDSKTPVFSVPNTPGSNPQTLNPITTGSLAFDPGAISFSFYTKWPFFSNRYVYGEDGLNTWESNTNYRHKIRAYPLRDANGLVPNAYIVVSEDGPATNGASAQDYQDIVYIVRNVRPADGGDIYVENRDWIPVAGITSIPRQVVDNWVGLQKIQDPRNNGSSTNIAEFHHSAVLRIYNKAGTGNLTLTGINIETPLTGCTTVNFTCQPTHFTFTMPAGVPVPTPATPVTIAPGQFMDLTVSFVGGSLSNNELTRIAALNVQSTDDNEPTKSIMLSGFWQSVPEGGQEPDVDQVVRTFGFTTTVVGPGQRLNNQGRIETVGEEVISPFWVRANPAEQVYVRQLAALHTCCATNAVATLWRHVNPLSGTTTTGLIVHAGKYAQSFLPLNNNTPMTVGQTTFFPPTEAESPGRVFGFKVDNEWSDPSRNNKSKDDCSGGLNTCGHHMRFWPARDLNGVLIPNTFIMGMDFAGINYDFNDNMYLITNITPYQNNVDLVVDLGSIPNTVPVNQPLIYTFTVENRSVSVAKAVTASTTLPIGMTFTSATTDKAGTACSQNAGVVTCNLGDLNGEQKVTINVTGTPAQIGIRDIIAQASVGAGSTETNPANNSKSVTTTVFDPTNVPGTIIVELDSQPNSTQSFGFTANNGLGNFSLVDNGDATLTGYDLRINFQSSTAAVPSGYLRDFGEPYGARTGANQGWGMIYGWIVPGTSTPLNISSPGNGRDRGFSPTLPQELDTVMHMQTLTCCNSFSGTKTDGAWEIALPNGWYRVTVSVGDAAVDGSTIDTPIHRLNVEGVNAINNFSSVGAAGAITRFANATVDIEVVDGKLTLDANGGYNTKLNYVRIQGIEHQNRRVFTSVNPGSYLVTQTTPAGWSLANIVCNDADGGTTVSLAQARAAIDLDGAQTITCRFINTQQDTPQLPVIEAIDNVTVTGGDPANVSVAAYDPNAGQSVTLSATINPAAPWFTPAFTAASGNQYTLGFTTPSVTVETVYTITVRAETVGSPADFVTAVFTLTLNPASQPVVGCTPISTLSCAEVPVSLPFALTFAGETNGLDDKNGVGTGFTMVDPPSARLSADNPVTFTNVPGYEPGRLTMTNGQLIVSATKGIQFRDPAASSETNSQINALGVGFDYNGTEPLRMETTIVNPAFNLSAGNNSQQAGLWFGLNENNYAKLVLIKSSTTGAKVQLSVERYIDTAPTVSPTELNTAEIPNITTSTVNLILEINPITRTVRGYYSVNGGELVTLSHISGGGLAAGTQTLNIPAAFLTGVDHDADPVTEPITYGGIFTTLRRAASSPTINFTFDQFQVYSSGTVPATPTPTSTPVTPTNTPTDVTPETATETPVQTATDMATETETPQTLTVVPTATDTAAETPTNTPENTPTSTATSTPVETTAGPSSTPTDAFTATPTATATSDTGQGVVSFTLVNAQTDQDIRDLVDGEVIDLATLGTTQISVRINTSPARVGSVVVALNTNQRYRVDESLPYTMANVSGTDYLPWAYKAGVNTIKATPFTLSNGQGTVGTPLTINISFIDSGSGATSTPVPPTSTPTSTATEGPTSGPSATNPPVTSTPTATATATATATSSAGQSVVSYTLVDAQTDQDIRELVDGETIDLASLGTSQISVRINTSPSRVGSVVVALNTNQRYRVDESPPYTMANVSGTDYLPWAYKNGQNIIKATPFTLSNGQGTAGAPLTITIYVVNTGTAPVVPQVPSLLTNGGFDTLDPLQPQFPANWKASRLVESTVRCIVIEDVLNPHKADECSFRFKGGADADGTLRQVLQPYPLRSGDALSLNMLASAKNAAEGGKLIVKVKYADGKKDTLRIALPEGTYDLTQFSDLLILKGEVAKLKVIARYTGDKGQVIMDNIALISARLIEDGSFVPLPTPLIEAGFSNSILLDLPSAP